LIVKCVKVFERSSIRSSLIGQRKYQFPRSPPLFSEIHHIVAKFDALMELCDALGSRLKERTRVHERLEGAVVKQVAG
jgi:hypothetical protein